jgi:cyanate permease
VLVAGSVLMGLTIGNVTTLSPIIVRREFGAASFGAVYGIASCLIQLATGLGPSFYGLLHDAFGGYRVPLLLAAAADLIAAAVVVTGGTAAAGPLKSLPKSGDVTVTRTLQDSDSDSNSNSRREIK